MGLGFGMDFFAGLAEGKPTIPDFKPIDVQEQQKKATAGNLSSLPGLQNLASQVNTFNQAELERMLATMIPGYAKMRDTISGNIQSQLSGQIPKDVSDNIQRNSAVKSLYGGYSGTPMGRNLTARDLGLTSLQLTQAGLDAATRWIGSAAKAPQMDITGMFIDPKFQALFAQSERDSEFQRDYVSNMNDWQHSTGYLWGQDMRNTGETIKSLLSSYLGGMAGCWVAREVFGNENPQWLRFRHWLFYHAPEWFRNLYLRFGERFAVFIKDKPRIKAIIRRWMESRING